MNGHSMNEILLRIRIESEIMDTLRIDCNIIVQFCLFIDQLHMFFLLFIIVYRFTDLKKVFKKLLLLSIYTVELQPVIITNSVYII